MSSQNAAADKYEPTVRLYRRQIEATDRQIDALVAMRELRPKGVPEGKAGAGYGLTEEEVGVVEALRKMRTLKGTSVISGFQWSQWFGGRAD